MKVVDASALAAVIFAEPEAEEIIERLVGAKLIAPPLLAHELTNVCVVKCRRDPERRDLILAGYDRWATLGVHEVEIDHKAVLMLALETRLSAYDASYLWLARRHEAELVTLDKALTRASSAKT